MIFVHAAIFQLTHSIRFITRDTFLHHNFTENVIRGLETFWKFSYVYAKNSNRLLTTRCCYLREHYALHWKTVDAGTQTQTYHQLLCIAIFYFYSHLQTPCLNTKIHTC